MTAQSLGRAMSTLVVQERHLWLCLADMKEHEKVQFLCHRPASSATLSRAFSQKQTEAIKHIMHRRKPAAAPQPARRHGRPPAAAPAPAQPQQPSTRQRRGAGRRQDAQPVQAPPNLAASASARGPETGDPEMEETAHREMVTAPLPPPEEGRVENLLFRFVFVPPLAAGTQNINKRAVSSISASQEEESGEPCITGSLPSSSLARQRVVAQEHHSCPFVEPGKGGSTPVPTSSRHTRRNQVSVTLHTQTRPPAFTGPRPGPCVPPRCPTGPSRWLLRTIRLGYAIQFARRPPKFRASGSLQSRPSMPLSCMRKSQTCWRRMRQNRSLQPI